MINHVVKFNNKWVEVAEFYGSSYPLDIVQDCYIKLIEYFNKNKNKKFTGQHAMNLMYINIRWAVNKEHNGYYLNTGSNAKRDLKNKVNIEDVHVSSIEQDYDTFVDEKIEHVFNELQKLDSWFDRDLFKLYYNLDRVQEFTKEKSIRKLSNETKIGVTTIFNSLKDTRTKIKNAWHEKEDQRDWATQ